MLDSSKLGHQIWDQICPNYMNEKKIEKINIKIVVSI